MKKGKITHYDETNFTKSPMYKKYVRKRRKEKLFRFITLPSFLWVIAFIVISALLLTASYFTRTSNPWLSGVLVSIACGIITGVILYFLSNLRSIQLYNLQMEQEELYPVYEALSSITGEKIMIENSRNLGTWDCSLKEECEEISNKLGRVSELLNSTSVGFFEEKEGLENLFGNVNKFIDSYEFLYDDNSREKWLSNVYNTAESAERKISFLMDKNSDKIRFIKKYIF